MTIVEVKENAVKQYGNAKDSFSGNVRSIANNAFVKGDSFVVPKKLEVFTNNINGNAAEFIYVEVKNGTKTSVKQFYPSLLWRRRELWDDNNEPTGEWASASGSAVDELQKYTDVQSAMTAWAGKTITFSDIQRIKTNRYGTNQVRIDTIPVIDIK